MPPAWHLQPLIERYTQPYPSLLEREKRPTCLEPARHQESIYRPLINDYLKKNRQQLLLKRNLNLPQHEFLDTANVEEGLIFHVCAVGFNANRTRALVFVGHLCGSLCGGGTYHFMIKKDAHWVPDKGYAGMSCAWASRRGECFRNPMPRPNGHRDSIVPKQRFRTVALLRVHRGWICAAGAPKHIAVEAHRESQQTRQATRHASWFSTLLSILHHFSRGR
jgi:hypothetical protein